MKEQVQKTNKNRTSVPGGGGGAYLYKHPSTIWEQIKEEIIAMIITGELRNGDKVTSIAETAGKYKCGKSTAQKVLENLCEEGVLYKEHGRGFFVNGDGDKMRKELEKEYLDEMNKILLKYISKGKKIGMTNEQIIEEVESMLKQETCL